MISFINIITVIINIIMNRKKILASLAIGASFLFPISYFAAQRKEGQIWSWGFGRNGELGLGSQSNISLPQLIKNSNFVDMDTKKSLAAGITKEGKILTWGKNRNGVLGHYPPNINVLLPRQIQFGEKIVQVSCGYQHMCVVTDKGEVFVWGLQQPKSKFRAIGTKEAQKKEAAIVPVKINLTNIRQASCANDYITFVNNEGRVFVLGDMTVKGVNGSQAKTKNDIVELDLNNIKKISSGINYSIALDDEGKVYGWGNNTYGQLGTGSLKNAVEPLLIESLIRQKVTDISCGDNYSGVVTQNGQVYTWGFGNEGQLGHGDKCDQFAPRKLAALKAKVKAISCGGAHTAILTETGQLYMVGRGREGQLGRQQKDESNSGYSLAIKQVQQLPKNSEIKKVVCGGTHTLVLLQHLL